MSGSAASTPPPTSVTQIQCICCKKNGPVGKVLKCVKCGMRAHAGIAPFFSLYTFVSEELIGIIGAIVDPENVDKWQCDLCLNEESLEGSLVCGAAFFYRYWC